MFYTKDRYFLIGGLRLSLKNPCAIAILLLAAVVFLARGRLGRAMVLARHTLMQMLPYLVPLFCSFFIWVVRRADVRTIWNGMITVLPQLAAICVAAATLYLFGGRGVWYCLGAMCLANLLQVLDVIREGGLLPFWSELLALFRSFGLETGPLIRRLELHDLTFAFGPFLIYLPFTWREHCRPLPWFLAALAFFLIGLKRIAVPGVILGLAAAMLLRRMPEKGAKQTALCAAAGMMILSFVYLAAIRYGLFDYLETTLHLDTKGRMELYRMIGDHYTISPVYLGHGLGYERTMDWMARGLAGTGGFSQIHNDFLRMYVNVGFAGYWLWLVSYLILRTDYWFSRGGKDSGCLFFGVCVYCFLLYTTDNTIYYLYTTIACSLVPMACRLDALADAAFWEPPSPQKNNRSGRL